MKRMAFLVSALVLVFGVAFVAQTQTQSVEQELIKLENQWVDALLKRDVAFLDRTLADDYLGTGINGRVETKTESLASMKSSEDVITSLVIDDVKVRVYGDAAVVTGRSTAKETYKGKDVSGQTRWTDMLIKRGGRWVCVASHSSRIAQKQGISERT